MQIRGWRLFPCVLVAMLAPTVGGCPPPPVEPESAGTVSFIVVNNSTEEVAYLHLSPQNSESWGPDVLGTENTIEPGQSHTLRVAPGVYDLMLENFDHEEIGREMGVAIVEDSQWILYPE
ncbi:MAG: hypothetical protein JXB32_07545 [Deltaproteobacteria bacterium]|nr:hypothetical protein [Deltaproteobacteria bacterium]